LHLDLCEWVCRDDEWIPRYERVDLDDADALDAEIAFQLAALERLTGHPPTHLDSHQHVHRDPRVAAALDRVGPAVPVRDLDGVAYVGSFYGQSAKGYPTPECITVDALVRLIASLAPGSTELGCHPGYAEDTDDPYRDERRVEVATLCDPAVRRALDLHHIELTSFKEQP
jgi:predicted glycoside hydrolase/deacetylase ChbG (UPF0249 family)